MKPTIILFLLLLPITVFAQYISGRVIDAETGLPVVYASVSLSNQSTVTSYSGQFNLNNLNKGDTIRVRCIGYRSYKIAVSNVHSDTLTIYLHQGSIMLRDVNIRARHNYKQDSINLRKQFASTFDYKAPTFKDMFATVDPYIYVPYDYITSPNNATMVVNVNLLSVVSLLSKKKAPQSKLQHTLLEDEANNYVDQRFTKERITAVTGMKGDSLTAFVMLYRPATEQTNKMNDYQMMLYIKKCYAEFVKNYNPKRSLFSD